VNLSLSSSLTIHRSSALVAAHFVVERELHGQIGDAVATAISGEPALTRYLAAAAMAHGWRAGLWESHLPVSPGLPVRAELVATATARLRQLVTELMAAPSGSPALRDLAVMLVSDLYPKLASHYERCPLAASPVSDGPLAVAATRAATDLHRVASEGMTLLALPDAERPVQASVTNRLVEALIRDLTPPLH
jgi:hypothetical protein